MRTIPLDVLNAQDFVYKLTQLLGDMESYFKSIQEIRSYDLVQSIIEVCIDDAFSLLGEGASRGFFSVTYEPPEGRCPESMVEEINEEILLLLEKFSVHSMISDMLEEFLLFGSYYFHIHVEQGKGVLDILDVCEPQNVLPIYERSVPVSFVEKRGARLYKKSPDNMVPFTLQPRKVRIRVTRQDTQKIHSEFVKVGRSLIYPALSRINSLRLFDMASIGDVVRRAETPLVFFVGIPPNTSDVDVAEILSKYERELSPLHSSVSLDSGAVFASGVRVKCLPRFEDGKGGLEPLEIPPRFSDLEDKIQRQRREIAYAVGIPPQYITGDNTSSRLELVKLVARYSRRLAQIQSSVGQGVRYLVNQHLKFKGKGVTPLYIKVRFRDIIDVDLLDRVDYAMVVTDAVNSLTSVLSSVSSSLEIDVNTDAVVDILNSHLSKPFGIKDLFTKRPQEEQEEKNDIEKEW